MTLGRSHVDAREEDGPSERHSQHHELRKEGAGEREVDQHHSADQHVDSIGNHGYHANLLRLLCVMVLLLPDRATRSGDCKITVDTIQ